MSKSDADFWESKYTNLFVELQNRQQKWEQDIEQLNNKYLFAKNTSNSSEQKARDLEMAVRKLGTEIKEHRKTEDQYLKERSRLLGRISQFEKTQEHSKLQYKRQVDEQDRMINSLKDSLNHCRNRIEESKVCIDDKEKETGELREEIAELKQYIATLKSESEEYDVNVLNDYDRLFSKYLDCFIQDEESIRHKFFNKTTHGSNNAFKMLLQVCHDDLTTEVKCLKCIVPNLEDMVQIVLFHKLEIKACMYFRTVQLRYSTLFDGTLDAQLKIKELTKYKIQFQTIDLNNARSNFVMALLEAIEKSPQIQRTQSSKNNGVSQDVESKSMLNQAFGF